METTPIKKKLDIDFVNYLFLATIFLLLVASLCINHIVSYVAFMGFCIGACFLPEKTVVCDLFFLMPFAVIFKASSDTTSFFTLCELISLFIFFIKGNKVTLNILLISGLYIAYLALCKIFIHDSEIFGVIKQGMNIVLLFYFVRIYPIQEYKKLSLFFIVGMLLSSFIALFADYIPNFYEFVRRVGYNTEIKNRFTGLNGDPNYYSVNIILAFGLLISLYYKKDISKLLFWGIFVALSVFGLLTYSKSFLLMYAIVCLIVLVLTIKTKDVIGFGVLIALGSIIIVLALIDGSIVNLTIQRLLEADDLDSLTTNRSQIWKDYIKYILHNPMVLLFGEGVSAKGIASLVGKLDVHAHNTYIDIIYRLGVVGTLIFIGCVVVCFMPIKKKKKSKKSSINYLGFFSLALMYIFLHALTAYEFVFQLFLAYLIFSIEFRTKTCTNEIEKQFVVQEGKKD